MSARGEVEPEVPGPPSDAERVRGKLDEVAPLIVEVVKAQPQQRILMAMLGARLRERRPGFSAGAHGFRTLKELALACGPPIRVDQGEHDSVVSIALPRVRAEWWRAVTAHADQDLAWYDMAEERLEFDQAKVEARSTRYIDLPRVDEPLQRALLETCISELPELAELRSSTEAGWPLGRLADAVRAAGAGELWARRKAEAVVDALAAWGRTHGIADRLFLEPPSPAGPPHRRATPQARLREPSQPDVATTSLRARLHDTIDAMTLAELLELRVPARFLLDRG